MPRPCAPHDLPHVRDFLIRLTGILPLAERTWRASCPCEEHPGDKAGKLGVSLTRDGVIVVRCARHCPQSRILAALDIGADRLRPEVLDVGALFRGAK